jgi:hypothetical protein
MYDLCEHGLKKKLYIQVFKTLHMKLYKFQNKTLDDMHAVFLKKDCLTRFYSGFSIWWIIQYERVGNEKYKIFFSRLFLNM